MKFLLRIPHAAQALLWFGVAAFVVMLLVEAVDVMANRRTR